MQSFTVEELVLPVSIDAADAGDFIAGSTIIYDNEAEAYGHRDQWLAPGEVLPWWQDSGNPHRLFGVRLYGQLVGCGVYEYLTTDPIGCWALVSVLPQHRGKGIGTAIADRIEAEARADGRSKILSYFPSPNGPGERIVAPTGFGSVPAGNAEVRFALSRGFRLEQVERGSRLTCPSPPSSKRPPTTACISGSAPHRLSGWSRWRCSTRA